MRKARAALFAVYLAFAAVTLLDMLLTVFFPGREMVVAKMFFSELLRLAGAVATFVTGGM